MLDLTASEDRKHVFELIKQADIVISNFKTDSAVKLGMDYDSLKADHSTLIYGSITAYGNDNPAPGFDVMIQAETGWIYMNGQKECPPAKLPVALVDVLAAHQLKQGLLIALLKKQMTGEGSFVSVSLFDASIAALTNQASNWLNADVLPQRMGSQHPNIAPYGDIFYSRDQVGIILGTGTQKQFEGLCDCLDLAFLKTDERFQTNSLRLTHRPALNAYLSDAISKVDYADFKKVCDQSKVTIAPVNDMEAVFNMPEAQKLVLTETLADGREVKCVRTAVFQIK